jgi:hypothetical protein
MGIQVVFEKKIGDNIEKHFNIRNLGFFVTDHDNSAEYQQKLWIND